MSLTDIKIKNQGFTIVELLIVVVVIAILAAITIVSYNGITTKANASAAKETASNVIKKVELYNGNKGSYPTTITALTASADSGEAYYIQSGSIKFTTGSPVANPDSSNGKNTVKFETCGTAAGVRITYWDFEKTGSDKTATMTAGDTSGTCTAVAGS